MLTAEESAQAKDLQDWLLELHQLKGEAQSRHDTARAGELQAEIEELTAYLDEVLEAAVERSDGRAPADKPR
jgi:hypothetical protein